MKKQGCRGCFFFSFVCFNLFFPFLQLPVEDDIDLSDVDFDDDVGRDEL